MMNDLSIIGRMVDNPELKKTANGTSVCNFRIACERSYVRQGSQRETDFFDVSAWRNTAEFISQYFTKGQLIGISGSIQKRMWEDKEGKKHWETEIMVDRVHFVGKQEKKEERSFEPGSDDFAVIDESESLPF